MKFPLALRTYLSIFKAKVTLRSRDGLVGDATVEGVAEPGMLLRKV